MSALAAAPLPFSPYGQAIIAGCVTGTPNPLVTVAGTASIVMPIRNLVLVSQWFNLIFEGWLNVLTANSLISATIIIYSNAAGTTEITRIIVPQVPVAGTGASVRFTTSEMVLIPGGVANGIYMRILSNGSPFSIYNTLDTGATGLGVWAQPIGNPNVPS
jgi:hypothetical protein